MFDDDFPLFAQIIHQKPKTPLFRLQDDHSAPLRINGNVAFFRINRQRPAMRRRMQQKAQINNRQQRVPIRNHRRFSEMFEGVRRNIEGFFHRNGWNGEQIIRQSD